MTKSRGIRERRGVRLEWLAQAEPKICACGCGGEVTPKAAHYPNVPDFLRGHHARVKPPPGRPKGPEKPRQLCECGCGLTTEPGNRFIHRHGSRWTDDRRAHAREQKLGERNPMFGKPAANRLPPKVALPCGCGCGELATPGRFYISGHNGRLRSGRGTGRQIVSGGYARVRTPDHPFADPDGYVLEHRLVAEHALRFNEPGNEHLISLGNRTYLNPDVVVHHIDGDKLHNEPNNLLVMTPGEHTALHHAQGDIRG